MSKLHISVPEYLDTLFWDSLATCCEPDIGCPAYDHLTLLQYGFRHKDNQCEIFLYNSPIGMARHINHQDDIFQGSHTIFNRLKGEFGWGCPNEWQPSSQDKIDMDMLLTWLPKKQAKRLFNADCAAVYPMNFRGKKCRNKFTWGRGVVFQSGSGLCYLYFIFSDGARPFEEYLEDIKGVFKLENRKKKKEPIF